jgi:hypothetical protein
LLAKVISTRLGDGDDALQVVDGDRWHHRLHLLAVGESAEVVMALDGFAEQLAVGGGEHHLAAAKGEEDAGEHRAGAIPVHAEHGLADHLLEAGAGQGDARRILGEELDAGESLADHRRHVVFAVVEMDGELAGGLLLLEHQLDARRSALLEDGGQLPGLHDGLAGALDHGLLQHRAQADLEIRGHHLEAVLLGVEEQVGQDGLGAVGRHHRIR